MITDVIGNYLTKIRNALQAQHTTVEIPLSKLKEEITKVLYHQGYIKAYSIDKAKNVQGSIHIVLKYSDELKIKPAIKNIKRISKPSLRKTTTARDIPKVLNGLGIVILSTSQGVITDKEARKLNIGGEVVCSVY